MKSPIYWQKLNAETTPRLENGAMHRKLNSKNLLRQRYWARVGHQWAFQRWDQISTEAAKKVKNSMCWSYRNFPSERSSSERSSNDMNSCRLS